MNKPAMKILFAAMLVAGMVSSAHANPGNPAAVSEFKSQTALANKGERDAQYRLGEMYEKGIGTNPDLSLAIIWYGKASQQGDKRAADRLVALDRHPKSRDSKENEQERVDSVMKALRQQEAEEAARARAAKEKAANEKAVTEARTRQQNQDAARAQEKAAAEAAAAKARAAEANKPVTEPIPKPAVAVKKETKEPERTEFNSNPCKGPQAKFLSTCN